MKTFEEILREKISDRHNMYLRKLLSQLRDFQDKITELLNYEGEDDLNIDIFNRLESIFEDLKKLL